MKPLMEITVDEDWERCIYSSVVVFRPLAAQRKNDRFSAMLRKRTIQMVPSSTHAAILVGRICSMTYSIIILKNFCMTNYSNQCRYSMHKTATGANFLSNCWRHQVVLSINGCKTNTIVLCARPIRVIRVCLAHLELPGAVRHGRKIGVHLVYIHSPWYSTRREPRIVVTAASRSMLAVGKKWNIETKLCNVNSNELYWSNNSFKFHLSVLNCFSTTVRVSSAVVHTMLKMKSGWPFTMWSWT